jgi:hypothetical protein
MLQEHERRDLSETRLKTKRPLPQPEAARLSLSASTGKFFSSPPLPNRCAISRLIVP